MNASTAVPTSVMLSVLINGSLGFGMLLAMLFCLGDIEQALGSRTGYPFMDIFLQATDSVAGTAVMGSIITTMGITTSVGMLASASRQFWSFARDRGIPGWRIWSQVRTLRSCGYQNICSRFNILGSWYYRGSHLLRVIDHLRRLPARAHQHRIFCRLQRPSRHVYFRSIFIVYGRCCSSPLPSLYGRYQQRSQQRPWTGQCTRVSVCLGAIPFAGHCGHCGQHLCSDLYDHCCVLQFLATLVGCHRANYEL